MANILLSSNMNLPVPVVGQEAGPQWATDINNSLTIIDQHNHSSGSGVQITPSGININSALTINNNSIIDIGALTFLSQSLTAANQSLYVSGADLYYVDGLGNNIRITQSGSVAGSAGTITGLPSGTASASYGAGTFVFQKATNTAAVMDFGSIIIRNATANSFGLTLSAPNALGADYGLTLPAIPGVTSAMTLDSSGNMGTITYDAIGQGMTSVGANAIGVTMTSTGANAIGVTMTSTGANAVANTRTRPVQNIAQLGEIAITGSCGNYSTSSSSLNTVPNISLGIFTSGRPVMITMIPDGSGTGSPSQIVANDTALFAIRRNGVIIATFNFSRNGVWGVNSLTYIDTPPAQGNNYDLLMSSPDNIQPAFLQYAKMMAYEL